MAYTSGVFFVDYVSGNDAARTDLTGCIASNPSGTITRITKTAHGLTTGAVVDLTLFSTWLNDAWKITKVDNNNFDLDGAVWQTTADNDGTVTPRGGSSWTDAWATINSGATSARVGIGDEVRIAQTEKLSTGVNATFTDGSRTVTLASALTKTIENANTSVNWTPSTNITRATTSSRKIGAGSITLTPAGAFTTGKVAYAAIAGGGTQSFSAYSKISMYFWNNSGIAVAADTYKICLCSDTTGDTIVNEINLPATKASPNIQSVVLDYGAALGSNIQSVAIYAIVDPGTNGIAINNIFACNDLHLHSIIGPENDCMYSVQAIDGTSLYIDSANTAAAGKGWSGTTATVAMYYVNPILHNVNANFISINRPGSADVYTKYIGGWNKTSGLQVGRTWFKSAIQSGNTGITPTTFITLEHFGIASFATPIGPTTAPILLDDVVLTSCGNGFTLNAGTAINSYFMNIAGSILNVGTTTNASPPTFYNCTIANGTSSGVSIQCPARFIKCTFRNNTSSAIFQAGGSTVLNGTGAYLYSCSLLDATEFSFYNTAYTGITWSYRHDNTDGNHWGFTTGGTINWQTTEKQGTDPGSWRVVHNANSRGTLAPISFQFAQVAVSASSLVTVKAWVKKDHATNVGCRIKVEGADYTLPGITETIVTASNSTSWQELTLTFTPTAAGIVPIIFESFYIAGNSNTYIGSITVTQ